MKSIADINAIKERMQKVLGTREGQTENNIRIVVGMATCGIAAGARPVLNAFLEEAAKRNLKNVKVTQAGCLGMCKYEPMAQVYIPGKEVVTYVRLDEQAAKQIIVDHIVNGSVVTKYTLDIE
ncbi:MAG: (2Fe-2S) ferredoxin domain-containing protein [Bacillota bacterium]|jgi:NADP-reducing hydrogenase subunit HndB|nr:(2Fe-2S) ferredoxin domain-containing protein [Bacillota bacterium]HHU43306.1 (2Fe-2S) ferredoxin domain-containing protein [Clostridiales bacterium]